MGGLGQGLVEVDDSDRLVIVIFSYSDRRLAGNSDQSEWSVTVVYGLSYKWEDMRNLLYVYNCL